MKQKPKTVPFREYYFGKKTRRRICKKIKTAISVVIATLVSTCEAIGEAIAPLTNAIADGLKRTYLICKLGLIKVSGVWYCSHCKKYHNRRTIKFTYDNVHGIVCSLCVPSNEPDPYEDCLDAVRQLSDEAKRFENLCKSIQKHNVEVTVETTVDGGN